MDMSCVFGQTLSMNFAFRSIFVTSALFVGSVLGGEKLELFDGKSLEGWKAPDMSYWSVEDGAITATASKENPCEKNQFLVWQNGEIDDFVLSLKFRIEGGPKANSGIQVRSQLLEDGHAVGYQVDIAHPDAPYLGAIYDEHGRKMLASRGEKTTVQADGTMEKQPIGESAEKGFDSYNLGEWNDYEITAEGNRISVKLNGHTTSEVVDLQEEERELSGILALQLHSGPPMKVQFKDIVFENLD